MDSDISIIELLTCRPPDPQYHGSIPPFALDRLHLVGDRSDQILYILPKPDPAGRTALRLSALEFLDRFATIFPPPRIHRHRYHGVFTPNAPLRPLVTARAHQDNILTAPKPVADLPLPVTPTGSPPKPETPAPQPPDTSVSIPEEAAQESLPDDLDQSPDFDPTDPEPVPDDNFDQSQGG